MDQDILVTVGIPVFNCRRHLSDAIKSVLNQSFRDFELILSDDGSDDGSYDIIKSFNDPRIIIVSDKVNRGISFRLNEQIDMARGKYFVRMDADDIMFSDRIQKQFNYLQSNPDTDVVGSQSIIIDENNKPIGLRLNRVTRSLNEALMRITLIHPTVMGKTAWFKRYRYSENLNGVEDFDIWIRSFESSSFYQINEPLLFYRDPVLPRLKTYMFRQKQLRKAFLIYRDTYISNTLFIKLYSLSHLKSIIYLFSDKLGLSKWIVARRNVPMDPNEMNNIVFILSAYQK
jgi:glycosyltransferase involved in cell wall biosynthesis